MLEWSVAAERLPKGGSWVETRCSRWKSVQPLVAVHVVGYPGYSVVLECEISGHRVVWRDQQPLTIAPRVDISLLEVHVAGPMEPFHPLVDPSSCSKDHVLAYGHAICWASDP